MKHKTTKIPPLQNEGRSRKLSIFKPLSMLLLILLFGVNNILGQTYTQITTLGALVDGDYLVVGDAANDGMMINTASATPFINFSAVTNPGSSISSGYTSSNVFQITVVSGQITIYNSSVGYVSWGRTGNIGNTATFFNGTVANTEQWTPTVSGGLWTLSNVATPGRSLQWNSASPRFACYTSAQVRLKLYKSASSATITGAATATVFTTTYGTPSTVQTFSVSGSGLTADITATAPTGFEVSNGGSYGATTTFAQSGGTASGTLSVRLKANAAVTGTYNSQNIVLSSTGATNVNVTTAASGNSVTAAALTITGVSSTNKIYNASAIGSLTGTAAYVGLQNSESFSVTGTPVATFAQSAIGTGIGVTVTGYTAPSTNYSVSQPSVSNADITAKPLTISGLTANNKVFDNTTTATLSGTAALVGVETADISNVTLGGAYVADFASAAVGTGIAVTVTGYTLSGSASGNYSLTQPTGLTADITASAVPTISGTATAAAFTTTYGSASTAQTFPVSGVDLTDDITATAPTGFEVSNGGAYGPTTTFTQAGGIASGTLSIRLRANAAVTGTYNSINVVLSSTGAVDKNITTSAIGNSVSAAGLTVNGITASNKVYDGNTSATLNTGSAAYVGLVNSESFSVSGTITGTFANKNVGNGKTVTIVGVDAPSTNYTVTQPTTTANITLAPLTISSPAVTTKAFDGNTNATITGTLSGIISPDVVTLLGTGTFASSAVGTGISVTSTSTLSGAGASNYEINPQPSGLTGTITAAPVLYNFGTGSGTSSPTSGTPVANLTFGNVTTGNSVNPSAAIISATSSSTGYTGVSGNSNYAIVTQRGAAFSTSTAAYYEVTITPATGYSVNLNSLSFGYRATASGANNIEIYTSADNFGSSISTYTVSNNSAWTLSAPSFTTVTSASALTIRIFGYNPIGTTLTSSSSANFRIDDLSINADGTLIPPPTASVLTGTGSFCAGSFTNLSVAVTGGASPYTVVVSDGGSNTFTATSVSPVSIPVNAVGTYTITSVTDANSGVGAGNSGSAAVTVNPSSLPTSVGSYTNTFSHADGLSNLYIDPSCNIIANVSDAPSANVLGSTSVAVTISATLPTDNTLQQFIPRYYTITPTSSGSSTVTFYFSQSDFTTYNSLKGGYYKSAPVAGDNADLNIGNLFLAQIVGGINGTITEITPSLNWNSANSVWECSATISNLGGEYYLFTKPSCNLMVNYSSMASSNVTLNSASITWDPVIGSYNGSYKIRVKPVSGSVWNGATISSTSYNSINLSPYTLYEYQVRVVCSGSEQGAYSASKFFTTLGAPCSVVTGLTNGTIGTNNASVSWIGNGATSYNVRIVANGNPWGGHNSTANTTFAFTNLQPGTNYQYQVRAVCNGVFAVWSSPQSFTTNSAPSCPQVTGLTNGTIGINSAGVSWSSNGADMYNVRIRVTGNSWGGHNSTSSTVYNFSNLLSSTDYEYQIRPICSGFFGQWSNTQTFTTNAAPSCPQVTGLTNGTIGINSAGVSWSSNGANMYNVRIRVSGNSWGGHNSTTGTVYNFTSLLPSTDYEYQIRPICSGFFGQWSNTQSFTTNASPSCPLVTGLANGLINPTNATINWTPNGATSYNVRIRLDGNSWGGHNSTTGSTYTFNYLTAGNDYQYQVRPICSGFFGEWSAIGTLSTGVSMKSIQEDNLINSILVYPNPTHSNISVTFTATSTQQTTLKVLDMTGRIVKMIQATTQEGTNILDVNLNELAAGMYTLHLFENNKLTHISKIQKQD
jgi:hypothetical protein